MPFNPDLSRSYANYLRDNDWRDANIDSLHVWHPEFQYFYPVVSEFLNHFQTFMQRYKAFMLQCEGIDSYDGCFDHCDQEVMEWLAGQLTEINYEIWYGAESQIVYILLTPLVVEMTIRS